MAADDDVACALSTSGFMLICLRRRCPISHHSDRQPASLRGCDGRHLAVLHYTPLHSGNVLPIDFLPNRVCGQDIEPLHGLEIHLQYPKISWRQVLHHPIIAQDPIRRLHLYYVPQKRTPKFTCMGTANPLYCNLPSVNCNHDGPVPITSSPKKRLPNVCA